MQAVDGVLPAAAVYEIVPVRNDIPERAPLVTERDAAIHAACRLLLQLVLGMLPFQLAPIAQPFRHRPPRRHLAFDLQKTRDLAHNSQVRLSGVRCWVVMPNNDHPDDVTTCPHMLASFAASESRCCLASTWRYSTGMT